MVWSDGWISGESGHAGRRILESTESVARPSFASLLAQTCTVLTSAVVARKAPIDAAGGFDESLRRGQDFDLWLRLAHRGAQMHVLTEPLVVRRVVATGLSGNCGTELDRVITVLLGITRKLPLDAQELAIRDQRLAFLKSRLEIELGEAGAPRSRRGRGAVAPAASHRDQQLESPCGASGASCGARPRA